MTDQFPKGWKPNKLGKAVGGPFQNRAAAKRAREHKGTPHGKVLSDKHSTVTAAADPTTSRRRRMFPPKREGQSK